MMKKRILIVDDEVDIADALKIALRKYNYEIFCVNTGTEALNFLDQEVPDLVVLDVHMPIMNGFEVCRHIRLQERTKNLPIIFLSARTGTNDRRLGAASGANAYLIKPFEVKHLVREIQRFIDPQNAP